MWSFRVPKWASESGFVTGLSISLLIPCSLERAAFIEDVVSCAEWHFPWKERENEAQCNAIFPVFFAENRELPTETGWLETGYTAIRQRY